MTYSQSDLATGAGLYTEHVDGGEAVTAYSLVYVDASGRWSLADASTAASMPTLGLATEALRAGFKGKVLQQGYANNSAWMWIAGDEIYATDVAGVLSQTAGTVVQRVGMAITATLMYFDPVGEGVGSASGCPILEGATAYVGFDPCKEPFTNYFLCDGSSDDVQIQAAIDYLTGLGGGSVIIERGEYNITDTLLIEENMLVTGTGFATILKLGDNIDLNIIEIGDFDSLVDRKFLYIRDMTLDGNNDNNTSGSGIFLNPTVTVTNVEVSGLLIRETAEWAIEGMVDVIYLMRNSIIGTCQLGIKIVSGNNYIIGNDIASGLQCDSWSRGQIVGNNIFGARDDSTNLLGALYLKLCKETMIIGNTIIDNARDGIAILGGIENFGVGIIISDNIIVDNAHDVTGAGIKIQSGTDANPAENLIIKGNKIYDTGAGVQNYGIQFRDYIGDSIIEDNIIVDNTASQIHFHGSFADKGGIMFKTNIGYNPISLIATPFDTPNGLIELLGAAAIPTASTDYVIEHADISISSTDSGNTDCAILIKDPSGNQINPVALSTIDYIYLPIGYKINWGAFTGADPTVVVSFN